MSDTEVAIALPKFVFVDPLARRWTLKINTGMKVSIKETTGVDLSRVPSKGLKALGALLDDDEKLMQAIWIIVEDQAKADGITPEDFVSCFDGDTYELATNALKEAVVLFSQAHSRDNLRAAVDKATQIATKTGAIAIESIDVDQEARKLIEQSGSVQAS